MSNINKKFCSVFGCPQEKEFNPGCTYFSLPTDPVGLSEWLNCIGRPELMSQPKAKIKSYYVCSSHFAEGDLKCTDILLSNAVPCLHLPERIDSAQALQLANSSIDWDDIILNPPAVTMLEPIQNQLGNDPENNDASSIPNLQDELTKNLHKLMQYQISIDKNSKDYLFWALNMYLLNPQAYHFIRDALGMPTEKVLRRIKLKVSTKLDKRVLDCLAAKLKSFPDKAKYCTVCVEPIYLKNNLYYDILNDELVGVQDIDGIKTEETAGMVYVLLLRSILVKWDQPITYCFVSCSKNFGQLESWIDGTISKLLQIGFEVKALVTHQGTNFKKFAREVKFISPEKHYFVVDNKKIYYIFEVPQLLKCVRNNLGMKDTYYNGNRVSWQYIESLYKLECKRKEKLIPKITNGHISPYNFLKMPSVKYATEIFSNTVSTAIHAYVDMQLMPEEARHTADFCVFMNNVFDVLNSSKYKSALGSDESQLKLLQEASNVFGTLEWKKPDNKKGKTKPRKTTENELTAPIRASLLSFQVTINSILSISQDLNELGHKKILTERLNLDPLEKFIDLTRRVVSKTKDPTKPTPVKFCRNFSKFFLNYISVKSPLSSRPNAFMKFCEDATHLETSVINAVSSRPLTWLDGETDYRIELPDEHATIYVASYIFHKCMQTHCCMMLSNYVHSLPDLAKTKTYDNYNRQAKFYGKLKLLDYQFIRYIEQLEIALIKNFKKGIWSKLGSHLFSILRDIPFDPPCKCFPRIYAVKLLIRLRIYSTIKAYNKKNKRANISISQFLSELNKSYSQ